jgi:transcriptional/translational regulatory protein YebC/TACO1
LTDDSKERLERFVNSCEDDDDMQWVITNFSEE